MPAFLTRLSRIVRPTNLVPQEYRQTFLHLYMDVVWYGILSGSTLTFIAVYATRQGATSQQIGLLTAAPAIVNLIIALPVGSWLSRRSMGRTVFWSSIMQRVFYLLLLPALFGEVVPLEWRAYVVGIRNAALAVVSTVFTIISGEILNRVAFPTGYQIVFIMGLLGAALSSLHLYYLSRIVGSRQKTGLVIAQPVTSAGRKLAEEIRELMQRGVRSLRLDAMRGRFGRIMLLLFGWHVFQYSSIPIITPFVVNQLHLSDQTIGLATALFSTLTFIGSLLLSRVTRRFGNKLLTGGSVMALSLFPIVTSFGATAYIFANIIGGFAWAITSGALYNYILENSPGHDLPTYLAWYNMVFNAAILIGSTIGPAAASIFGYQPALIAFGLCRLLAGLCIIVWG